MLCFKISPAAVFKLVYDEFKITKCFTKTIPLWLSGEGGVVREGWKNFKNQWKWGFVSQMQ